MSSPSSEPTSRASSWRRKIIQWVSGARYLTVSTLVHVALLLIFGGAVLFKAIIEPPDFTGSPEGLVGDESAEAAPPADDPSVPQEAFMPASAPVATSASDFNAVTTVSTKPQTFQIQSVASPVTGPKIEIKSTATSMPSSTSGVSGSLSKEAAGRIAGFTGGWAKGGRGSYGMPLRSRQFEFTAYLARYEGGDWNSTVWMEGDTIWGGSLQNLLFVIGKLSRDKIRAHPQAVPLDLSSDEIFKVKPPFIWFTGHRDFRLTDKELVNLADYLRSGGCIWGDSSLPGRRSRFDLAFRREMQRILPEASPVWEALPPTHPIFTNAYYPEIRQVPPGINYYDEPVYALKGLAGEIAVLYTANDYGDMWQFGIDEDGQIDLSRDDKHRMVAVNEEMWHRRNLYFRNIEPKALFDTYKFGTNIIVHLLTRWENKVRNAPRSFPQ